MAVTAKPLGRRVPTDWEHVEKFPLTALAVADQPRGVPVVLGVNWYTAFDSPQKGTDGRYWIGRDPKHLGTVRGGHCFVLKPSALTDLISWYGFYNQGREGACVGFGSSRCMTLLNRKRYFARWLWDEAKASDEWPETNPGDSDGTSVRAAMEVLRMRGHVPWTTRYTPLNAEGNGPFIAERDNLSPTPGDGIAAYRWATDVQDVLTVLDSPLATRLGAVPLLNSWGESYPHITWMPAETLDRLRRENGEVAIPTDR